MKYVEAILFVAIVVVCTVVTVPNRFGWKAGEKDIIGQPTDTMRVYKVTSLQDSLLLRQASKNLTKSMLRSDEYAELARKMLVTVTAPQNVVFILAKQQMHLIIGNYNTRSPVLIRSVSHRREQNLEPAMKVEEGRKISPQTFYLPQMIIKH